jgi:hypothetical protein
MTGHASPALNPDNDRQVSRCWQEWDISGQERRVVLCVETALEMRPGFAGFDPAKLDMLVHEATELMHASASPIDSIRIVPQL